MFAGGSPYVCVCLRGGFSIDYEGVVVGSVHYLERDQ